MQFRRSHGETGWAFAAMASILAMLPCEGVMFFWSPLDYPGFLITYRIALPQR